jgi:hypothetical protein
VHPSALPLDAGVDVAFSPNCGAILFGHAPLNESDTSGTCQFGAHITTDVTFSRGHSTPTMRSATRGAGIGANGWPVTYTSGKGSAAGSGNAGGGGGRGQFYGADGGDGAAGLAPGKGGDWYGRPGLTGVRVDTGVVAGGSFTAEVTAGVGGGVNLFSSGPAPSSITLGQSGVPTALPGVLSGTFPPVEPYASTSAGGTVTWPTSPIAAVYQLTAWAGARAVVLPTPGTLALPAGSCRRFLLLADSTIGANDLFIYPPNDGTTRLGNKLFSDGTPWRIQTAPGAHVGGWGGAVEIVFDGTHYHFGA